MLAHYDPQQTLELAVDASPYGLGAVIMHVTPEGKHRPIAFASRSLNKHEKGYSQIDKEALAIMSVFICIYMAGISQYGETTSHYREFLADKLHTSPSLGASHT